MSKALRAATRRVCVHCKAANPGDTDLCRDCRHQLRRELRDLPWWLHQLAATAWGQARITTGGRAITRSRDTPAPPLHEPAADLLTEITDGLAHWCRALCEDAGAAYAPAATGAGHAIWLARNINAIASSDHAADIAGDVLGWHDGQHRRRGHRGDIERIVDRPARRRHLGACPTDDCGHDLPPADEDTATILCRHCGTRHDTLWLLRIRMDQASREGMTWPELARLNRDMPAGRGIAPRTLRHWRNRLPIRGDRDGQPLHWWSDVEHLAASSHGGRPLQRA